MRRSFHIIILSLIAACAGATDVRAVSVGRADDRAANPGKEKPKKAENLTVAIFDFEADSPGKPDLGKFISQIIAVQLSGKDGIDLVERVAMDKVLNEQKLSLTGAVKREKAVEVGNLAGANVTIGAGNGTGAVTCVPNFMPLEFPEPPPFPS